MPENGRWCEVHGVEHQPREQAVRCWRCHRLTWEPHGACRDCETAALVAEVLAELEIDGGNLVGRDEHGHPIRVGAEQ